MITLVSCLSGCVNPGDLPVTIQGSNQKFASIRQAITNAVDGDTILIQTGIYKESIRVNRSITLIGAGANKTIIVGDKTDDVITIVSENVTIKNCGLRFAGNQTYPDVDAGIDIQSDHVVIDSVSISDCNYGTYMYGRSNHTFFNLKIINSTQRGIYMNSGTNISITDTTIENSSFGVYWIRISDSVFDSNQLIDNEEAGLYLGSESEFNQIEDNSFTDNNYGLHIKASTDNNITRNLFLSNIRGIYVCCGGRNNLIYNNVFLSNIEHAYGYQVNRFNSSTMGNYWDDYTGVDENNDGIGDTPYNATYSDVYGVSNIDYLPLMNPSS